MGAELGGQAAARRAPRVTVLHVVDISALRAPFLSQPVVAGSGAYIQEEIERMEARSGKTLKEAKQQLAALKLKGTVCKEQGAIAPVILKHAPKRDGLLVVGSKGLDALDRFMLGSVSTNHISYATVSGAGRQGRGGTVAADHLGDRWVGRIGPST
jgi:nucleotide-binding universal stress UspA family protein